MRLFFFWAMLKQLEQRRSASRWNLSTRPQTLHYPQITYASRKQTLNPKPYEGLASPGNPSKETWKGSFIRFRYTLYCKASKSPGSSKRPRALLWALLIYLYYFWGFLIMSLVEYSPKSIYILLRPCTATIEVCDHGGL